MDEIYIGKSREEKLQYDRDWRKKQPKEYWDSEKIRIKTMKDKLKKQAYQLLGNRCAKCGCDYIPLLNIDHINNDGHLERGRFIYTEKAMRDEFAFRMKYQLLCFRCNWIKRYHKGVYIMGRCVKLRLQIINILGGAHCVKCGFSDIRGLHIDHIHNNGKERRKENEGSSVYRFYLKNPELIHNELQVLCANCNLLKKWNESGTRWAFGITCDWIL